MMAEKVNVLTLENGITVSWAECGNAYDCAILDENYKIVGATYATGMTPYAILMVCIVCRQVVGDTPSEREGHALNVLRNDPRVQRGPLHVLF